MEYAQSLGAMVAEVEVFDEHQINILRVLVYWVPAILALIFRRRLFSDSTRIENLFVNMSIVSAFILTIGLVQGANLYARMAAYFEICNRNCVALDDQEAVYQAVCTAGDYSSRSALFWLLLLRVCHI